MKNIESKFFILPLLVLAAACGVGVPDYRFDDDEHRDGPESHLAKAFLENDKSAIAYWLEKAQEPSLALCYLLDEAQYGNSKIAVTMEMLNSLFERGANPNVICEHDRERFSPLSLAVRLERPDIVQYLLGRKANPNLHVSDRVGGKNFKSMSSLMVAISRHGYASEESYNHRKENREIVERLLAAKADINYQGSFSTFGPPEPEDKTALMIAVENMDREMIELLLEKGARKDLTDAHGKTAEAYAANAGHLDLAQELAP